jgi:hypothetical protein
MKTPTILLAGIAALALTNIAQADTTIVLTGSTAYRGPTHLAIQSILPAGFTFAYTGANFTGASQAIFTSGVSPNKLTIKTSWSGAVAGIQTVAQGLNVNVLPDVTTPAATVAGTPSVTPGTVAQVPDIAMTDNYQNAPGNPFKSPVLNVDNIVGVIPFKWIASNGAPAGLNNITPQLAHALFGAGSVALSTFTGSSSDEGISVFATGRDPDSGTRLIAFAETSTSQPVFQWQPTISGTAVTSHIPWPPITINGIDIQEGDGGYSSGGTLATTMTRTTLAGIGGYYVTYVGLTDANTAVTGGAKELTYNGVPYSLNGVLSGQYTFWGYEHLMYKSTLPAAKKTWAQSLVTRLLGTPALAGSIRLADMRCGRPSDGGDVTQNF